MAAKGRIECLAHHIGEGRNCKVKPHHTNSSNENAVIDFSDNLEELSLGPRLQAHPKSGLNDEMLDIRVQGLLPGQKVMLRAHVFSECGQFKFESRAEYIADDDGKVIVQKDPSLGGSFTGVEPMGLIWGVEPSPEHIKEWPRLVKKNISEPFVYHFRVLDEEGRELAASSVERWFLADYVQRILVTHGKAQGCLYLPNKKGSSDPMPVLIDVRGGVPYLVEDRPALLASHGFATFSLDYFRKLKEGNVKEMYTHDIVHFDLQIIADLFDYIESHPRLDVNRVGIVSSCLGSVLSLNFAARLKHLPIRCVSATGCPDQLPWSMGLELLDGTKIDPYSIDAHAGSLQEIGDGFYWSSTDDDYDAPEGDHMTPVEDITVPMLFFIPMADEYVPSVKCMNKMIARVEKAGNCHLLEVVPLEGAGHFIDAPYVAHCKNHKLNLYAHVYPDLRIFGCHGGELKGHAYSVEKTWRKTINWFRQHLGVREMYREDWLDVEQCAEISTSSPA